ncbi:hypothetical protein AGMMS49965_25510 [Bacteroidia bacterium]|nr:hypothetical protein AGMMS49965_25510 [Bacteroidia bacterium]
MQSNYVLRAREKYDSYDPSCWTKAYFDYDSGGFNVYHKDHQFTPTGGGGEAEKIVGLLLAKHNGKQVEFLPEQGFGCPVPDLGFDEQTWDVKSIGKAKEDTIRKHIKDARKANNALFYFTNDKYDELISAVNREVGYLEKSNRLSIMPNIYYMNKQGILTLIWHK